MSINFLGKITYSGQRFGAWRILFGIYQLYEFIAVFPFAHTTYLDQGVCIVSHLAPDHQYANIYFPDVLLKILASHLSIAIGIGILASLLLTVGLYRRVSCFFLWAIGAALNNCSPMVWSPEVEYINFLNLMCVFIPAGEAFSIKKMKLHISWAMPSAYYYAAWIVITFSLSFSGLTKIFTGLKFYSMNMSYAWFEGTFMYHFYNNHMFRYSWYGDAAEHIPMIFFKIITYGALLFETLAFPFMFLKLTRRVWWIATFSMTFINLFFFSATQVLLGMMLVLLFLRVSLD